jgi:hypothetical protein
MISAGLLRGSAETFDYLVHPAAGQAEPADGGAAADSENLGCFREAVALDIAKQKHFAATFP